MVRTPLLVLTLLTLLSLSCSRPHEQTARPASQPAKAEDPKEQAHSRSLAALSDESATALWEQLCPQLIPEKTPPEIAGRCRERLFDVAQEALDEGKLQQSKTHLQALLAIGPDEPNALWISQQLDAADAAVARVQAAAELQRTFDSSMLKGWQLKFAPRGKNCDVLHVEGYTNLDPQMMEAMAYGTLIYGKVLPGGVNSFAFGSGFRDVVYTNEGNSKYVAFGASKLTRKQARQAQLCTREIAIKVRADAPRPPVVPETPNYQPLSWKNARVGTVLYNGSFRPEATIVAVDRSNDLIKVRYEKSGSVEDKTLSAVAQFWYVKPD
jgi:hypothetical protein